MTKEEKERLDEYLKENSVEGSTHVYKTREAAILRSMGCFGIMSAHLQEDGLEQFYINGEPSGEPSEPYIHVNEY